jgi:hypothetical protein
MQRGDRRPLAWNRCPSTAGPCAARRLREKPSRREFSVFLHLCAGRKERIGKELAARHRQRRDLRRTGIVRLAEAGATTPQIAAISGHAIDYCQRIIDTYLPRRTEVAIGGIELRERGDGSAPRVVRLADAVLTGIQTLGQWAPVSETQSETRFPKLSKRLKKNQ